MTERGVSPAIARWHLSVQGVVQGIGFRPFVYRLAHELGLSGWVQNTTAGVAIEVEGPADRLTRFLHSLHRNPLPLACIVAVEKIETRPLGTPDFCILPSRCGEDSTLIPPDVATCSRCLAEVFHPRDRRFWYPFTNCTYCGPRFTITRALPYDRSTTTMAAFPLCPVCTAEYTDPTNRRFHAEPIACPVCGPRVWLAGENGETGSLPQADCLTQTALLLRQGALIALKGLGGFHLVCDATNPEAVLRLRKVKDRQQKPLAVMVATLADARGCGEVSEAEAMLLTSPQAPIVLVRKRRGAPLAAAIAPRNAWVGLMLPYTPLHHLLVRKAGHPLVVTSGNRRDEPLCRTDEEATHALGGSVDAFVFHDRPIHQRCDDSVFFVTATGPQPIRRSRGYTPSPIHVPVSCSLPVLALGPELKNTLCLLRGQAAFVSQHIGDMHSLATQEHFAATLAHLRTLLAIEPATVAHDLHPHYATSRAAPSFGLPCVGVQHHHAHIAACLADNGVTAPTIGVAFDGTGYGTDGAIWGGEFFIADLQDCRRVAHLAYLPLPGGEAAIRRPYRTALAYLLSALGSLPPVPFLQQVPAAEQRVITQMVERQVHTPPTSSCGRLFDAVAALIGVRSEVSYEAQAAIELEALSLQAPAENQPSASIYPFTLEGQEIGLRDLFRQIVHEVQAGVAPSIIGRRFHETLAEIVRTVCDQVRTREGLTAVALSGGCWQNRLLLAATLHRLQAGGFTVHTHRQVPANDGGISLGQAVVAAARQTGHA